ncbi:MAG: transposase [Chloroflexi bacterium]|nr:transposase [Chloroflexota bacterium]
MAAPTSTKNRAGQRDPEMRQVKKGNQYYFGMKLHIGADAQTGLVHSFSEQGSTPRRRTCTT